MTKYMAIAMLPSWANVFPLVLRTTSMLRVEGTHGDTIGEDIYKGSHSLAYLVIEQTHNYLEDAMNMPANFGTSFNNGTRCQEQMCGIELT